MAVRKRTDRNSWIVDVVINGRRIRESYKTKREAIAREKELFAHEMTGTISSIGVPDVTFRRFVHEHYLDWGRRNKAKRTFEVETYVINARLVPFFGAMILSDIDLRTVERYNR